MTTTNLIKGTTGEATYQLSDGSWKFVDITVDLYDEKIKDWSKKVTLNGKTYKLNYNKDTAQIKVEKVE